MYHKPDLKIISVSYLTHNSVVKNTFKELETKLTKQHVLSAKVRIFLPRAVLITIYQDPSGYRNILNNNANYKTSMRNSNQFNKMFLLPLLKEYGQPQKKKTLPRTSCRIPRVTTIVQETQHIRKNFGSPKSMLIYLFCVL